MLAITEHGVTLLVASLTLTGVIVTSLGSILAARASRQAHAEVKRTNGGTFAESMDARLSDIERRLDRIERGGDG